MRNEQQIVELAKAIRANETLEAMYRGDTMGGNKPAYLSRQIIDLLHLIIPEMSVVVDWGKGLQTKAGDTTVLLLSRLETPQPEGKNFLVSGESIGLMLVDKFGVNNPKYSAETIINTPDPAPPSEKIDGVLLNSFNAFETANILHAYINERRSVQKIIRRLVRTLRGPNLTEDEIEALGATLEEALFPNPAEIL